MKSLRLFVMAFAMLPAAGRAAGADLALVKPEQVGMSSERLGRVTRRMRDDAARKVIPGAVLLVARKGGVACHEAAGSLNPETGQPMTADAVFRIYSMTKPITTVAAMMLVEEGRLTLSDPLAKYLPAFKDVKVGVEKPGAPGAPPALELVPPRRPVTIHDLMRHTSGLTQHLWGPAGAVRSAYAAALDPSMDPTNEEFAALLAKLPLLYQPGTTWEYGFSTEMLGRVVEVVSGQPLSEFVSARLLQPLGMRDTGFWVSDPAKHGRIAEPFRAERLLLPKLEISDPRRAPRFESGGGGMVSTAMDYAKFLQMLLNRGEFGGHRYLSPATVDYMVSNHLDGGMASGPSFTPGPGYGFGLGFGVRRESGIASAIGSPGEYYWGGTAGTYFWVDPKYDMFVVLMMQSPRMRDAYRPMLRNLVYAAILQ
jgi:CubicO group peptidase (beta-lactamase class C family)